MGDPTVEEIKALDGKIFAMLSERENEVLDFYRNQGRKYGVSVSIVSKADPEELARARSQKDADAIMKRSDSRISVTAAA